MKLPRAGLLLCCAVAGSGSLIRSHKAATASAPSAVDPSKWGVLDLIEDMNRDLVRMKSKLGGVQSFLQLSVVDSPDASKGKPKGPAVKAAAKSTATKSAMAADDKQLKKAFDAEAAVKQMDKLGPAQMPAMLGLLKGMYSSWKDKIGSANKREKDEKKDFSSEIADLELKKRKYKDDANATKTYDGIEKYWKRQREIAHRQYHTVLKIAHGGMDKFKTVMSAMEGAIASKKPSAELAKKMQSMDMPEVVLLQKVETLQRWARGAVSQLRDAKNPYPGML